MALFPPRPHGYDCSRSYQEFCPGNKLLKHKLIYKTFTVRSHATAIKRIQVRTDIRNFPPLKFRCFPSENSLLQKAKNILSADFSPLQWLLFQPHLIQSFHSPSKFD